MNLAASVASFSPHRWIRSVPWIGGLLIVAIVAMAGYDIVRGYRFAVENTERELEAGARDRRADGAQPAGGRRRAAPPRAAAPRGRRAARRPEELHASCASRRWAWCRPTASRCYDAQGNAARCRGARCLRPMRNIAERPPSRRARDPRRELGIGDVVAQRHRRLWALPIARRLETPAGEFAGIGRRARRRRLLPAVLPRRAARRRHDGHAAASQRHAAGALSAGGSGAGPALADGRRNAGRARGGRAGADAHHEPARRRRPLRRDRAVPDYPLAVVVTRDADVALAPWRAQAVGTALRTLALGVLAALLLAMRACARSPRLDAARDRSKRRASALRSRPPARTTASGTGTCSRHGVRVGARARDARAAARPETQPIEDWSRTLRLPPRRRAAPRHGDAGAPERRAPAYEVEYRVRHPTAATAGCTCAAVHARRRRRAAAHGRLGQRHRSAQARRGRAAALSEERYALAMTGLTRRPLGVGHRRPTRCSSPPTLHRAVRLAARHRWRRRAPSIFARMRVHPDDRAARAPRSTTTWRRGRSTPRSTTSSASCCRERRGALDPHARAVRSAMPTASMRARGRRQRRHHRAQAHRGGAARKRGALRAGGGRLRRRHLGLGLRHRRRPSARGAAREILGMPAGPRGAVARAWFAQMAQQLHPDDLPRRDAAHRRRTWPAGRRPTRANSACATRTAATAGSACAACACATRTAGRCAWPARSATSMRASAPRRRCASREERYALAMTGSASGHWVWDIATDALFVSAHAERAVRPAPPTRSRRRAPRTSRTCTVHPDDVPRVQRRSATHLAGAIARALDFEYRIVAARRRGALDP